MKSRPALLLMPIVAIATLVFAAQAHAQAGPAPSNPGAATPSRGKLLYETHCVACHDTQMHWRDKRSATDWKSLLAQVRIWQNQARLRWSEKDVIAVARYLNELVYHYPVTTVAGTGPRR